VHVHPLASAEMVRKLGVNIAPPAILAPGGLRGERVSDRGRTFAGMPSVARTAPARAGARVFSRHVLAACCREPRRLDDPDRPYRRESSMRCWLIRAERCGEQGAGFTQPASKHRSVADARGTWTPARWRRHCHFVGLSLAMEAACSSDSIAFRRRRCCSTRSAGPSTSANLVVVAPAGAGKVSFAS
jgi:hypothetical protein